MSAWRCRWTRTRVPNIIGAYAAVDGGVDAIAFTGGVGENSAAIRHRCLQRLDFFGAVLDEDRNRSETVGDAAIACAEIPNQDRLPCSSCAQTRRR